LKIKKSFDNSRNRGDLGSIFDGIRLPNPNDSNINPESLIGDNSNSRFGVSGNQKIRGSVVSLFK
jgi:hypothetical protein